MAMQPEFSRTVKIDTLGETPRRLTVEAGEEERSALARRFALPAIASLSAEVSLTRSGMTVNADGRLEADVTQSCVATGEPVDARIDTPFRIRFSPPPEANQAPDEEIELSEEECDTVFYEGASIDVGEAVAETLSLSLDPWPRSPGADELLKQAGVKSEEQGSAEPKPGPFSALAALKDKLE